MSSANLLSSAADRPQLSETSFNRRLSILVGGSLLTFTAAVVLRLGLGATPYATMDSAGRTMGFNDPLSWEHYGIMVRNFRPADFFRTEHGYDWLLLVMHAMGGWLLLARSSASARVTRWFFALQAAIFPIGLMLVWLPPIMFVAMFGTSSDREGFIDIPYILFVSQSTWVLVSLAITFFLRGPGLGMAKIWRALGEARRAFGQRFVEVVR